MRPYATGTINALVKWGGVAALNDTQSQAQVKKLTIDLRNKTTAELQSLGYAVIPSEANFFMVHIKRQVQPVIDGLRPAGNLRERPFLEIWRTSPVFERIRGLKLADFKTCAPCPNKAWCRRSPGSAYVLHGDYTGVDPWVCGEADLIRRVMESSPDE